MIKLKISVLTLLFLMGMVSHSLATETLADGIGIPVSERGFDPEPIPRLQPYTAEPTFFTHGDPSVYEQLMLEKINRARANPGAEAARLGIDLNENLPPDTLSDTPKPPLAFHPLLIDAARAHSQWMLDENEFDHTGAGGSSAGERMEAAGYEFTGSWIWGENISWRGTTGVPDQEQFTLMMHDDLFMSSGHRQNLLNADFEEIGLGLVSGQFVTNQGEFNALMGTQKFARSASTPGPLLLGVVYRDDNDNGIYDVGEGVAGVRVELEFGDYYTVTSSSGGYALPYQGTGTAKIMFSEGELQDAVSESVSLSGENIKFDLQIKDSDVIEPPQYASLSINIVGLDGGSGTVISNPEGIDCGNVCIAQFDQGTTVTLTANPDAGSTFNGWDGACSGTNACVLTMGQNRSVTASFTVQDGGEISEPTYARQVHTLFIGYFGRAPGIGGMNYYADLIERDGGDYAVMLDDAVNSSEGQAIFGTASPEDVVRSVFQSGFGRAPLQAGLEYWTGLVRDGIVPVSDLPFEIANNAGAADTAVLEAKIAVSRAVVAELDRLGNPVEYGENLDRARELMSAVVDAQTRDFVIAHIELIMANVLAGRAWDDAGL